jgi:glutathione S-transferase
MLRLWFAPNTCARVALTALEEIGEPFETGLIAFMAGDHRKPEYLAINPSGKVPALETPRGVLLQTGAMLTWLAETYPQAHLLPQPADAFGRACIQAELFRFSADLHPLVTRFVMAPMISNDPNHAAGIRAKAIEAALLQLVPINARLDQTEWYLGADWSVLDAYLSWIWFRLTESGFDEAAFPAVARHYARAQNRSCALSALARESAAIVELDKRGLNFRPAFARESEHE